MNCALYLIDILLLLLIVCHSLGSFALCGERFRGSSPLKTLASCAQLDQLVASRCGSAQSTTPPSTTRFSLQRTWTSYQLVPFRFFGLFTMVLLYSLNHSLLIGFIIVIGSNIFHSFKGFFTHHINSAEMRAVNQNKKPPIRR